MTAKDGFELGSLTIKANSNGTATMNVNCGGGTGCTDLKGMISNELGRVSNISDAARAIATIAGQYTNAAAISAARTPGSVAPNIGEGVHRGLTNGEKQLLGQAFNGSLNTGTLRVEWTSSLEGAPPNANAVTIATEDADGPRLAPVQVMDFLPQSYRADFSAIRTSTDFRATFTFVHEATHAWQIQHGVGVTLAEWYIVKQYGPGNPAAYAVHLSRGTSWKSLNIEQQAELVAFHWAMAFGPANTANITLGYSTPYSVKQMEANIPFFGGH
jgi:hypothetical protein